VIGVNAKFENVYFGRILLEAIGYFGSKIINYKRKCELLHDHRSNAKRFKAAKTRRLREVYTVSQHVVRHFDGVSKYLAGSPWRLSVSKPFQESSRLVYGATQAIGHILGERLYDAIVHGGLGKQTARALFFATITDKSRNRQLYLELCQQLRGYASVAKSKSERF
jgi:hypothetical protein